MVIITNISKNSFTEHLFLRCKKGTFSKKNIYIDKLNEKGRKNTKTTDLENAVFLQVKYFLVHPIRKKFQ